MSWKYHGQIMEMSLWMDTGQWTWKYNMDGQWTWMLAFTSSLVLYLARVQSEPHLIVFIDCDNELTGGVW